MRQVYLDYNATAPLEPAARAAIEQFLHEPLLGNPSSTHEPGQRARNFLESAREELLDLAGLARTHHLVFCSGGTEANHLAVHACAPGAAHKHVLTSAIEHPSLLAALHARAAEGALEVEFARVDRHGRIDLDHFAARVTERTGLVAVHAAHNELGTLQDLAGIRRTLPAAARLHADACQYWGKESFDLGPLAADTLAVSAHKLGGPIGIGALFVAKTLAVAPLLGGGGQERGWRAGTESALLAHAFAAAARSRAQDFAVHLSRIRVLRDAMRTELERSIPGLEVLTPSERALANTLCIVLPSGDGRALLMAAQLQGLAVSSGSACSSGAERPSAALLALGLDEAHARRALRLSLGPSTTRDEVAHACAILCTLHARFAACDAH